MEPKILLEKARQLNSRILFLDDLMEILAELTRTQQKEYGRHWHTVGGKCVDGIYFEVLMQIISLLACAWSADIFLRKSRDRGSKAMQTRYKAWRILLNDTLDYIENEVSTHEDVGAVESFQRDKHKINRLKCFINRLRWGY